MQKKKKWSQVVDYRWLLAFRKSWPPPFFPQRVVWGTPSSVFECHSWQRLGDCSARDQNGISHIQGKQHNPWTLSPTHAHLFILLGATSGNAQVTIYGARNQSRVLIWKASTLPPMLFLHPVYSFLFFWFSVTPGCSLLAFGWLCRTIWGTGDRNKLFTHFTVPPILSFPFLFWSHNQQCLGLTFASVFKNYSWLAWGPYRVLGIKPGLAV